MVVQRTSSPVFGKTKYRTMVTDNGVSTVLGFQVFVFTNAINVYLSERTKKSLFQIEIGTRLNNETIAYQPTVIKLRWRVFGNVNGFENNRFRTKHVSSDRVKGRFFI